MKKIITHIIIILVIALITYYFVLPPLNITSPVFWTYILGLTFLEIFLIYMSNLDIRGRFFGTKKQETIIKNVFLGGLIIILGIIVINIIVSPFFQAKKYAKRITIKEDGNFAEEIEQVDFNHFPLLDKASSSKIGDKVMGQMTDLVSQYDVSPLYTQINYNDKIIRVTPLEYNGIIKYFTNRSKGIAGYITVDSTTGDANLIRLEKGMKYMPSAHFFENLDRKIRLLYPTEIFGEESFEIDNEGNPYWIIPTIKYIGVGMKTEISGAIIFDPITGDSKKYNLKDIPTWVDHVYPSSLILEQINNWGYYRNGFLNSIFGQKNVVKTTEGYNYLAMNDDIYLYTGITSAISDKSNLGFVLTNLRTKETVFYSAPGAEEFSAMNSAEGQVQQMKYVASFPLLINLNGKPTYVLSLKDNAGLVKMYAFVDVEDYQKVVVTSASEGIEQAAKNYLGKEIEVPQGQLKEKQIEINKIKTTMIDGNTYYYLTDNQGQKYRTSIKTNQNLLPFLETGSKITIYYKEEQEVIEINKIKE